MLSLPDHFVRAQLDMHGDAGKAWLARLPTILDACADEWGLAIGAPFDQLSYHYVAPATRADGLPVVVKACSPTGEFAHEAAALRSFDGGGCARLLAVDAGRQVLLLERLLPGRHLRDLPDDDARTRIAAGAVHALWRPAPPSHAFPTLADWGRGFQRLRARYDGGTGPFPCHLVEEAESRFAALEASTGARVLLHGDLHHGNLLDGGPRGWLAIDPKGVVGDPVYETATFLRNCLPEPIGGAEARACLRRRVVLLAELLGFEPERIRSWGIAHAVLSAWWSVEDHSEGWSDAIAVAQLLQELRL